MSVNTIKGREYKETKGVSPSIDELEKKGYITFRLLSMKCLRKDEQESRRKWKERQEKEKGGDEAQRFLMFLIKKYTIVLKFTVSILKTYKVKKRGCKNKNIKNGSKTKFTRLRKDQWQIP